MPRPHFNDPITAEEISLAHAADARLHGDEPDYNFEALVDDFRSDSVRELFGFLRPAEDRKPGPNEDDNREAAAYALWEKLKHPLVVRASVRKVLSHVS